MGIEEHDEKQLWRCPQLGGEVPFKHCRKANSGTPCPKFVECWHKKVDVETFIQENYTKEELEKALASHEGRVETVFSIVKKFSS